MIDRGEVVCGWQDSNLFGDAMLTGLSRLDGTEVESAAIHAPGNDLTLSFSGGVRLDVFADRTNSDESDENYLVFVPERIVTIGIKSRIEIGAR